MAETGKFLGPLTEESLRRVSEKFPGIYYKSDIAYEIAQERMGREMAQIAFNQAWEKLEDSKLDKMTGFLRRDAFLEVVGTALPTLRFHNPKRLEDRDAALFVMLDIVDLHGINNRGGQAAGDAAIKATANLIRYISRNSETSKAHGPDIAGRLGGDEFAVYIPYHHEKIKHEQMIEIISERIERNRQFEYEEQELPAPAIRYGMYSIWMGQRLPSVEDLLIAADPKRPGAEPRFSYPINQPRPLFK